MYVRKKALISLQIEFSVPGSGGFDGKGLLWEVI